MYHKISNWLDDILSQNIPEDEDWLCDEITDFGTRENPFTWEQKAEWNIILKEIIGYLKEYLQNGKYSDVLKGKTGVGVGFVDGNIEVIYTK